MCIYFIYFLSFFFFFRDVLMLATLIRHDAETLLHSCCFGDGGMSRSLIGSRAPNVGGAYS